MLRNQDTQKGNYIPLKFQEDDGIRSQIYLVKIGIIISIPVLKNKEWCTTINCESLKCKHSKNWSAMLMWVKDDTTCCAQVQAQVHTLHVKFKSREGRSLCTVAIPKTLTNITVCSAHNSSPLIWLCACYMPRDDSVFTTEQGREDSDADRTK